MSAYFSGLLRRGKMLFCAHGWVTRMAKGPQRLSYEEMGVILLMRRRPGMKGPRPYLQILMNCHKVCSKSYQLFYCFEGSTKPTGSGHSQPMRGHSRSSNSQCCSNKVHAACRGSEWFLTTEIRWKFSKRIVIKVLCYKNDPSDLIIKIHQE